jgi:hypothetical protein
MDAADRHMDMLMCAFASRYIMVKDMWRVSAAAEMQGAVGETRQGRA